MDSIDDINDNKLQEDVEKCFKMYQNDIRNVNEILELGYFILPNNYDYIKFDNLYLELYKWKRMSQLIINLFNDYEMYRSLVVNPMASKDASSHYLVPDTDSRPSEDDVIQALYKYVLYFLLIQRKERKMDWDKMISGVALDNLKCWMCECKFELNEFECSACSEPIENTIRNIDKTKDVREKPNLVDGKNKLELNGDSYFMDKENKMEGVVEMLPPTQEMAREIYSDDQWKCYKCGTLNLTEYLTCTSCYTSRPRTCEVCETVYEASNDRCIECGHKNVDVKENNCKICHKNEVINDGLCCKCMETWICIFCNFTKNYRHMDFCSACGLEKSNVKIKGVLISRWKDDQLDQIWICGKCDHFVESKYSICTSCGDSKSKHQNPNLDYKKLYPNIPVETKLTDGKWKCCWCSSVNLLTFLSCQRCKNPRMEIWECINCTVENKMSTYRCSGCTEYTKPWKCSYCYCGEMNYGDGKFCKYCGLDKLFKMSDVVAKRNLNGKQGEVWICNICSRINEMYSNYCPDHYCIGLRPYVKKCFYCSFYFPDSSRYCTNCKKYR